jgi:hypothetical protein
MIDIPDTVVKAGVIVYCVVRTFEAEMTLGLGNGPYG